MHMSIISGITILQDAAIDGPLILLPCQILTTLILLFFFFWFVNAKAANTSPLHLNYAFWAKLVDLLKYLKPLKTPELIQRPI